MSTALSLVLGALIALALVWLKGRMLGFAAQSPADYAGTGPVFDLRTHLNGPIACEGVIYGPTGRVGSRFTARFDAEWHGDTGVMREHFRYDSGTTQDREWTLQLDDDGRIAATAPDVVGTGAGRQAGATVQLRYRIRLPADAGGHVLDTVDWMYLTEDGTIINRSQFRKFGIKVAELVATMRPLEAPAAP